jgi:nitric oxide reductase large subunit
MTTEAHILTKTEISRPELAALRAGLFEEGQDWQHGARRRIEWTPTGLTRLADHMGVTEAQLSAPLVRHGKVLRSNFHNQTLVEVQPAGGQDAIRMKVRSARLYMPGMECEFEESESGSGWVESRRPRSRGRF